MPAENCPLCRADHHSRWFAEEELYWIAECDVCAVPMAVYRKHGMPTPEEEKLMLDALAKVADAEFGPGWWLDPERRRIPDHWHAHARPPWGFFG